MPHREDIVVGFQNNHTMATVKPFRGVRPPQDLVEEIASRPYDVLDSEEARAEAGDNEKSLYHIIKPEIDFEPAQASMIRAFTRRLPLTSRCSRRRVGSVRTQTRTIISTLRP